MAKLKINDGYTPFRTEIKNLEIDRKNGLLTVVAELDSVGKEAKTGRSTTLAKTGRVAVEHDGENYGITLDFWQRLNGPKKKSKREQYKESIEALDLAQLAGLKIAGTKMQREVIEERMQELQSK